MKAIFRQEGISVDFTPAAAVSAGDPVQLPDGRAGVPANDIAANELGAASVRGVYDVVSASATVFAAGDLVGWDDTNKLAVPNADINKTFNLGRSHKPKANGQTTASVALNERFGDDAAAIANAGATYTATEQGIINSILSVLRNHGMIDA